jgi:dynein heavy chain 2, cytosolic
MGMIYFSEETLDTTPLVDSWLLKRPFELRQTLKAYIDQYFVKSIAWISSNASLVVETTKLGVVMNGLSHISAATDKISFLYGS